MTNVESIVRDFTEQFELLDLEEKEDVVRNLINYMYVTAREIVILELSGYTFKFARNESGTYCLMCHDF